MPPLPVHGRREVARSLAYVGLVQLAHGLIQRNVIDAVKAEYGWVDDRQRGVAVWNTRSDESRYNREVRSRAKNIFTASASCLKEMGALSDEDIHRLDDIRAHRDEVAHETAYIVAGFEPTPDPSLRRDATRIFFQLDKFWIEVALSSGFSELPADIDPDAVESGSGLAFAMALEAYTSQFQ